MRHSKSAIALPACRGSSSRSCRPRWRVNLFFVSERGLTSTQWSEYSENPKRIQYSVVPTSDITAETVTVDGFVLSQKDTAGVVSTATRSYTASGMLLTQTDGRGSIYNTTELCSKN